MVDRGATAETGKAVIPAMVRSAVIDGRVVVLNLKTEAYSLLNRSASAIWMELERQGGRIDEAIEELSIAANVPAADASRQVNDLVSVCIAQGLLATEPGVLAAGQQSLRTRRPRQLSRHLLSMAAWWSLVHTAHLLARCGFSRTYSSYARYAVVDERPSRSSGLRLAAQTAFLRAENFFAFRIAPFDCLPRSLALFRFLRVAGLPASHHIGGKFRPFLAMHAWVELDGGVVLDDPRCSSDYACLASLPPEQ